MVILSKTRPGVNCGDVKRKDDMMINDDHHGGEGSSGISLGVNCASWGPKGSKDVRGVPGGQQRHLMSLLVISRHYR